MSSIDFLFGIHNHQPVGNFDGVFEEAYQMCYLPQMEVLKKYPGVRMAIHHSGPLLEWIESNRAEYFDLISMLVERGQVEILSGGFYEPVLSAIPENDAIGQLEMMNDYIRKRFGYEPQGMWLAERIWDPGLPKIIAKAGLRFTLLDDTHFQYADVANDDMHGYYMTEMHGHPLAVFPIDKKLRYSIPFDMPEDIISYLRTLVETETVSAVTYGDDGEKFGVWPETHQWVYGEGWLEKFYTALEESADFVHMTHFCEFLDRHPANGRLYLPIASYEEMSKWSLDSEPTIALDGLLAELDGTDKREEWKPFIRGGIWYNFFAKYEESNRIHKKMIYVSTKLKDAGAKLKGKVAKQATAALYRSQCNCAYWHGMFGGLYLNYLRHALYKNIIDVEKLVNNAIHKGSDWVDFARFDFDADGNEEIIMENNNIFALIAPSGGGSMDIFDFRPKSFSLTNTLTRRKEAYHHELEMAQNGNNGEGQPASIHDIVRVKEENLTDYLIYDQVDRHCFQDRFLDHNVGIDDYRAQRYDNNGDFVTRPYSVTRLDKNDSKGCKAGNVEVAMARDGHVKSGNANNAVTINKSYGLIGDNDAITATYEIFNQGSEGLASRFAVEFNLTLLAGDAEDRYWTCGDVDGRPRLKEIIEDGKVDMVGMQDDWSRMAVMIKSDKVFDSWRFPVETVSQSESGFERIYQGSCMALLWDIELDPDESTRFTVTLGVEEV